MGRRRVHDRHLPERLFKRRGKYYYATKEGPWIPFGSDEAKAIERAKQIGAMTQEQRQLLRNSARSVSSFIRTQIHERDGYRCIYCGTAEDLGIDHVIPYEKGGSSAPFNLVTACWSCNSAKGDSDPRRFLLEMKGLTGKVIDAAIEKVLSKTI